MQGHKISVTKEKPQTCRWCHNTVIYCRRGTKLFLKHRAKQRMKRVETLEHQRGKYLIKQYFEMRNWPAELEVYLPDIGQRPDIWTCYGQGPIQQQAFFEFQCAYITYPVVQQRTQAFKKSGYLMTWILGGYYFKHVPDAFLSLDQTGVYAYYFKQTIVRVNFFQTCKKWSLHQLQRRIRQGLRCNQAPYTTAQKYFYAKGLNILQLPLICLNQQALPIGAGLPHWCLCFLLWSQLRSGPKTYAELLAALADFPWRQSALIEQTAWKAFVLRKLLAQWYQCNLIFEQKQRICLNEKNIIK